MSRGQGAWLAVVVCLYLASFFLPVSDGGTPRAMYGFQAFFGGLVSLVYIPMWLANPAMWFGCIRFGEGRWKAARNAGLLATLLGVSEIWFMDDQLEIGYYLWVGSMVLLASGGAIGAARRLNSVAETAR
jgi:hypothetical protein